MTNRELALFLFVLLRWSSYGSTECKLASETGRKKISAPNWNFQDGKVRRIYDVEVPKLRKRI